MELPPVHVRLIAEMLRASEHPTLKRAELALAALSDAQRRASSREQLLARYRDANDALAEVRRTHSQPLTSQLVVASPPEGAAAARTGRLCEWLADAPRRVAVRGAQRTLEEHLAAIAADLATQAPAACDALQCILRDDGDEGRQGEGEASPRDAKAVLASACAGTLLVVLVAMLLDR